MLYNAVVHRRLIDRLRSAAGRVFPNRYPDVFSGFALGSLAGQYPSISVPMHLAGSSGASFGIANLFHRGRSPLDEDFRRLNDEGRLPHHPTVPDLPISPEVPVADSFQFAKAALFPHDADLRLDRELLLRHCLAALPDAGELELDALRASAADDHRLSAWLTGAIASRSIQPRPPIKLRPDRLGSTARRCTSTPPRSTWRQWRRRSHSPITSWASGARRSSTKTASLDGTAMPPRPDVLI